MANLFLGGGQEGGRRAGTENVLHIVGAGADMAPATRHPLPGARYRRRMPHTGRAAATRLCCATHF